MTMTTEPKTDAVHPAAHGAAQFRVGTASIDITPESSCELTGFAARTQPCLGVHDPIYARAIVFEAGAAKAAVVSCDLLGFDPATDRRIRRMLRESAGLDGVILGCTHTHSGPACMPLLECGTMDDRWMAALEEKLVSVVRDAARETIPATMRGGRGAAAIGMNRRQPVDGKAVHLSVTSPADEAQFGEVDSTVTALQFIKAGSGGVRGAVTLATIFNAPCHPVSLGHENREISADWPGVAAETLQKDGYGMVSFLQGACGDINPDLPERGWAGCEAIGREAANAIRSALADSPRLLIDDSMVPAPIVFIERNLSLPYRNGVGAVETTISALRIGEAAFATLPGEAFTRLGRLIRESSPFPVTIVAAYANGNLGYIPTRDAYPLGGYEVEDAHHYYDRPDCVAPEAGERCVEAALDLLEECRHRPA